jgi:hypothetical protein
MGRTVPGLGPGRRKPVGVRVPSPAPHMALRVSPARSGTPDMGGPEDQIEPLTLSVSVAQMYGAEVPLPDRASRATRDE